MSISGGVLIKGGSLKNVIVQKWQPVITHYGFPKQLLIVEKHQYNFSCSLHLYIKQNRTFLITNLSNINIKSCVRNQTHLYIHLVALLDSSNLYVVLGVSIKPKKITLHCTDFRR